MVAVLRTGINNPVDGQLPVDGHLFVSPAAGRAPVGKTGPASSYPAGGPGLRRPHTPAPELLRTLSAGPGL